MKNKIYIGITEDELVSKGFKLIGSSGKDALYQKIWGKGWMLRAIKNDISTDVLEGWEV